MLSQCSARTFRQSVPSAKQQEKQHCCLGFFFVKNNPNNIRFTVIQERYLCVWFASDCLVRQRWRILPSSARMEADDMSAWFILKDLRLVYVQPQACATTLSETWNKNTNIWQKALCTVVFCFYISVSDLFLFNILEKWKHSEKNSCQKILHTILILQYKDIKTLFQGIISSCYQ